MHYQREVAAANAGNRRQIALLAAAMTLDGFKGDALSVARERFQSASAAEDDVTGVAGTLSENQLPSVGAHPQKQLFAVARKLDPGAFEGDEE
ncbi:hypothetical protein A7X74_10995 [Stenotrophomonas maltophilia]|nr:hypothetical protein A7X74_10995 [Stenotrophomonas maltophilia]